MGKWILVVLVVVITLVGGVIFFYSSRSMLPTRFIYDDLANSIPGLAETQARLAQEGKFSELGIYLEPLIQKQSLYSKERIYLQYITMRAYVHAARTNGDDLTSFDKAVQIGQELIGDQRIIDAAPNFVAFSVDVIDRLSYPGSPKEVQNKFVSSPFFSQQFADQQKPTDIIAFRKNLLEFGDSLDRVTNIKMKMAALALNQLRNTTNPSTAFKIQKEQVLLMMREAESSLLSDRQNNTYPFGQRGYLTETLLTKAYTAQGYESLTHETPFGPVDDIYKEALEEAKENNPFFIPMIQTSYDRYLETRTRL